MRIEPIRLQTMMSVCHVSHTTESGQKSRRSPQKQRGPALRPVEEVFETRSFTAGSEIGVLAEPVAVRFPAVFTHKNRSAGLRRTCGDLRTFSDVQIKAPPAGRRSACNGAADYPEIAAPPTFNNTYTSQVPKTHMNDVVQEILRAAAESPVAIRIMTHRLNTSTELAKL